MGGVINHNKLLCFSYLKIEGICSPKTLKFKYLKYAGENTDIIDHTLLGSSRLIKGVVAMILIGTAAVMAFLS